jgi:MFS family permease
MAVFGSGNVASLLARYAGADLAPAHSRGRALSLVLFATTFGAVAGPTLVGPTRTAAEAVGLPALAGPFLLAAVAYLVAAAVLAVLLRPDPLMLARAQPVEAATTAAPGASVVPPARAGSGSWAAVVRGRAALGLLAIVAAQFVMVLMMTMTPVHMADHGHGLTVIGFVISAHIAGMYALSPVAGWLTDRVGRVATIVAGAGMLAAAGLLGGIADPDARAALTVSLFLLGLGWSLVLVAGSTLLTDSVPLHLRAQAQGNADLLVGASATVAAAGSGVVLDLAGWAAVAAVTVAAAVLTATVAVARHGTAVTVRP